MSETIKLIQENTCCTLFDIGLGNILGGMSSQTRETKPKINKWDYVKLKRFCKAKETINKMKRQPTEWEKISRNKISNKGLTPRI